MKQVAAPLGVFIILMAIYLWTLAPGNFWIDSAAFTACNEILGLPHSPSFPLYTIMGRTIHALLPVAPATASNLYSALTAAAGGVVCFLILNLLLAPLKISTGLRRLAAVAGTLYAFLAVPIWQSAVRAEVYSLQVLLSLLVIYLFLKAIRDRHTSKALRFTLAMVFLQGLSFANHSLLALTTVPLVLSIPFFLMKKVPGKVLIKLTAVAVLAFCFAISAYLYLPIRSNQDPAINSGQPKTIAATLKAITRTGESYLPSIPPVNADYLNRLGSLTLFVYDQTGGLVLLGLITGIIVAARQRNKILLLLIMLIPVGFAVTVWAADFKMLNFDIVAYSALPLMLLMIVAFYGLSYLAEKASERAKIGRAVPIVLVLMVFFQFSGNLFACDLSKTAGPDRLAKSILKEAPPDAILMVNEDNIILPLWYHCYALSKRPDLAVISAGALYRPSYRNELQRQYPGLEYPEEFAPYKINDLGQAINSFCRLNASHRPIMIQYGVPGIGAEMVTPQGFLFQYDPLGDDINIEMSNPSLALLDNISNGATDLLTKDFIARTAFNYGVYYDRIGQVESAYRFFQYAIETDSDNPNYLLQLGIAFLKAGKDREAILLLQEAIKTGEGCPEAEGLLKNINDRKYGKL